MTREGSAKAMDALSEVKRRQNQVIERALVPGWYWWAVAAPTVGLGAVVDTHNAAAITAAAVGFAIGISALTAWIAFGGRSRVKVHDELLGAEGAGAIVAFVGLVVAGSIGIGLALQAANVGYPGTLSTLVCAVALVVGGPALMRLLRRIMLRRGAEAGE
jgi:hypothetical protein